MRGDWLCAVCSKSNKGCAPWNDLMKVTSSIVTDDESLNSGDRNGLWKKLEEEKALHDSSHGPLLKVWCAAHGQIWHIKMFLILSVR